jgi:transglutaminase-like putative cysteine protease
MNRNCIVLLAAGALLLASAPAAPAQDNSDEAQRLFRQGQDLVKSEKYDQALDALKKAVQLAPSNDLFLATLSDCEFKAGHFADGLEHAQQAIKLNDKAGPYYVLAAANAYGEQDLDRAREYSDVVLKREKEFGPGPANDARRVQNLVVPKTYTLFWDMDPQKGRLVNGALPIAMAKGNLPYQTVTYEISGVQSHRLVKGDVNDVLYVVPQGTKPFALTMKVTVQPYSYKKELAHATAKPLPEEARTFLGPCEGIDPKSPALKKVVAGLKGDTAVETVRNILAWMKKNIEYKLDQPNINELDFKLVDEIIDRGHAECRGYAMLFTGLCRAAGVPARPVWGLYRVMPGQDQRYGDIASHNWAEVYVSGCGWVPADPQHPETLGFLPTNILRFFMDSRKVKGSTENLPLLELVNMKGDKVRFEESR